MTLASKFYGGFYFRRRCSLFFFFFEERKSKRVEGFGFSFQPKFSLSLSLQKLVILFGVPIVPSQVACITERTLSAEEAAEEYEFALRQAVRNHTIKVSPHRDCPCFDLVLLCTTTTTTTTTTTCFHSSPDHFYYQDSTSYSSQWVVHTDKHHGRIALTLPVLNSAANVAVIIAATGGVSPLSAVAPLVSLNEGCLVWFVDPAAAPSIDGLLACYSS
ncbi:probable 6-phosphogluconolactonase 1 isoform X2 [Amborella trichopoda]|uniref:probable 6-phosphogluconolactonase 1 isoform X2 n=1 Tax=Amborella trichopoda TaxID=13333 RepID=UPI0009C0138A|nr:probable 6-phosphogluconolactonase 1 isoform X2 [Amborella trichopoda]|eukprot:XP_020528104.1 probable 6-phosphogluconolactonase 1 isoform X2 [Amborella trichopoda]